MISCTAWLQFLQPATYVTPRRKFPTSEAFRCSVSQNFLVFYVYNSPLLVPVLTHMSPAHTFLSVFKIYFNIIPPHILTSYKWHIFFIFFRNIVYVFEDLL